MTTNMIDLPLIVDIDTGFGNAINVTHTVRILEQAGASAIQIEDQHAPKRCGHFDGKELIPPEEMVGKVRAAVDTRRQDLVVIARTIQPIAALQRVSASTATHDRNPLTPRRRSGERRPNCYG